MKASIFLLLAVAAVAMGLPGPADVRARMKELNAQQAKWARALKASSGYVMFTGAGQHFLPKNESTSQILCSKATTLPLRRLGGRQPPSPRRRRSVPLQPLAGATGQVSHSIADVFALLRKTMERQLCSMTVLYHKQLGHPTRINVTACRMNPSFKRVIQIPKVAIVRQAAKLGPMCSLPRPIRPVAQPITHHLILIAAMGRANLTAAARMAQQKRSQALAKVISGIRFGTVIPAKKIVANMTAQLKRSQALAKVISGIRFGTVIPSKKIVADKKKPTPLHKPGMRKTGDIPATFMDKASPLHKPGMRKTGGKPAAFMGPAAKKASPLRKPGMRKTGEKPAAFMQTAGKKQPSPLRQPGMRKTGDHPIVFSGEPKHGDRHDHREEKPHREHDHQKKEHEEKKHGHHAHGEHKHGESKSERFINYWRNKDQQFRHFVMRRPWVLPTAFAGLGVLISGVVLLAIYIKHKRRAAARSQDGHTLLINDEKVLIEADEKPASSFYVNEVCA